MCFVTTSLPQDRQNKVQYQTAPSRRASMNILVRLSSGSQIIDKLSLDHANAWAHQGQSVLLRADDINFQLFIAVPLGKV